MHLTLFFFFTSHQIPSPGMNLNPYLIICCKMILYMQSNKLIQGLIKLLGRIYNLQWKVAETQYEIGRISSVGGLSKSSFSLTILRNSSSPWSHLLPKQRAQTTLATAHVIAPLGSKLPFLEVNSAETFTSSETSSMTCFSSKQKQVEDFASALENVVKHWKQFSYEASNSLHN